ncbi:hypothetical protein NC653_005298 [Populus alba x Populus x berolinensis]|uniref:Exostosin GT47 domain-containing protein n=2 Tax=Populus TaxID=3689 RepID=A0A4U5QMY6_POPAL|nr:hypothetical protein NC653_005298 [Populus alba x Populus x berolinensis]TKS10135.1 hypothetical protein D5086_0000087210 [Populus alba]
MPFINAGLGVGRYLNLGLQHNSLGLLGIFEDKLTVTPIGVAKLMTLPESMNLTALSTETTSWRNEFAIPYPTYFHPSTDNEVFQWQNRMQSHNRRYLFAFAGAPRPSATGSSRN